MMMACWQLNALQACTASLTRSGLHCPLHVACLLSLPVPVMLPCKLLYALSVQDT